MLERQIERYLAEKCAEIGALCDKFSSPQKRSVPDRIVTYEGRVVFVELKATNKEPTDAQHRDHQRRRTAGAIVVWLNSTAGVHEFVHKLKYNIPFDCEYVG